MNIETRDCTIANLGDAKCVARQMFDTDVETLLDVFSRVPLGHGSRDFSFGVIVYEDGKPVGCRMAVPREYYIGNEKYVARMGSTLCMLPTASTESLIAVMKGTTQSVQGSSLYLTNTACKSNWKMHKAMGLKLNSLSTHQRYRFCLVSSLRYACRYVRRILGIEKEKVGYVKSSFNAKIDDMVVRSVEKIDSIVFDDFWKRYLKTNKGLVFSRTAENLSWIFKAALEKRDAVILVAEKIGVVVGYIVLRAEDVRKYNWWPADLIAIKNDEAVLSALLKGAIRFLKNNTSAIRFGCSGYSSFADQIICRYFDKHTEQQKIYPFIYRFHGGAEVPSETLDSRESWFFGPYDGDMCFLNH